MAKQLVLAVAGSGKTKLIVDQLDLTDRFLIVTYTINNIQNLRNRIITKFGYFPPNIKLASYFNFIYNFCFKPFLATSIPSKGITWNQPPFFPRTNGINHFRTKGGRLYSGRIAKLINQKNINNDIKQRIEKYYDHIFIDEIQDFAGHDFNLLSTISSSSVNHIYVGDFFQHTYDTSADGNVNSGLHDDFNKYVARFVNMGFTPDLTTLQKSYRCSPATCDFISTKLKINIEPANNYQTTVKHVVDPVDAVKIYHDSNIVKLFLKEHYKYNCYSQNWGNCKGEDRYNDVCVVLNPETLKKMQANDLHNLATGTKNKLYVACSRAKQNLYLVSADLYKPFKVK